MPTNQTESTPAACDGKDHGLTPKQKADVDAQAHAFNLKLQGLETDKHGNEHYGQIYDATNAFWHQLGQLPVAERREMIKAFEQENQELAKTDPALPTMKVQIDSDAFMESATVNIPEAGAFDKHHLVKNYWSSALVYPSYGMCAEFDQDALNNPPPGRQSDRITWGQLVGGLAVSFFGH
jgi:hypothetical protein